MAGSLGYAERLSWREDLGGQLGDPELSEESELLLNKKLDELASLIRESKSNGGMVVHTGAGISTSTGIPDFRGPKGIWTLQRAGEDIPKASCQFDRARPSLTHMALVALQRNGYIRYLVSCNVDCLHVRSGYPRALMAELHGNCFAERCERCEAEYIRDFEMSSVGFKVTGRKCTVPACKGARLRDQVLDWEDALPPKELKRAEKESRDATLALVLGSSLQITPSRDLPDKTIRGGKGNLAIVNLQATCKDKKAKVLIHEKTDKVLAGVMRRLSLPVPDYVRTDRLVVSHVLKNTDARGETEFVLRVGSCHGWGCPVPWLAKVRVTFSVVYRRGDGVAGGDGVEAPPPPTSRIPQIQVQGGAPDGSAPFQWKRKCPNLNPEDDGDGMFRLVAHLTLTFGEGCTTPGAELDYVVGLGESAGDEEEALRGVEHSFETIRVTYSLDDKDDQVRVSKEKEEEEEESKQSKDQGQGQVVNEGVGKGGRGGDRSDAKRRRHM